MAINLYFIACLIRAHTTGITLPACYLTLSQLWLFFKRHNLHWLFMFMWVTKNTLWKSEYCCGNFCQVFSCTFLYLLRAFLDKGMLWQQCPIGSLYFQNIYPWALSLVRYLFIVCVYLDNNASTYTIRCDSFGKHKQRSRWFFLRGSLCLKTQFIHSD